MAGYRLLRRLGQGVHGTVHLAESLSDGAVVALKLLKLPSASSDDPSHAAFLRHAQMARRLVHPDIVALHAAGIQGDLAWLAMEPVPGSDLQRYTAPTRLLPEPVVLNIGARMAAALAHAHRQGVVHRDIKPANVLVDWPSRTVKLADFGVARADDGQQTGTGIVLGSPSYMSPELLAGAVPTARSDLYALGTMLYQLLTGRLPHEGASMGELLRRVAENEPPDPRSLRPDLPAATAQLLLRMLAKRAADRPADGDELARQLLSAASFWPTSA